MRLPYFQKPVPLTHPLINIRDLRVASPCSVPWDAMAGTERVRHCEECNLNVYNLSSLTEVEIQRLIAEHDDRRICIRFYRRADGTILTQDCPRALQRLAKRVSTLCAAVLSALVTVNCAVAKSRPQPQACSRVQAEESSANMLIIVSDPDGAAVPSAKISLLDKAGKTRFSGKTGGDGSLTKNDLPSGDYTLKVTVRGFREYADVLRLERNKNVRINLKLSLAATSTTVEVTTSPFEIQGTVGVFTSSHEVTLPVTAGRSQPGLLRQ